MSFHTLLFVCGICEREVRDWPGRDGRHRNVEPICLRCEHIWTDRIGRPQAGAFMDRRKAMHVIALSNALHNEASVKQWEARHGRA